MGDKVFEAVVGEALQPGVEALIQVVERVGAFLQSIQVDSPVPLAGNPRSK